MPERLRGSLTLEIRDVRTPTLLLCVSNTFSVNKLIECTTPDLFYKFQAPRIAFSLQRP
jgi:hypothetical protein